MLHVFAYLDAGTGSMILQALMGGFAGLVVLSRVVWQSFFSRSASAGRQGESANEVAVKAGC
jgi:hypothetical protein